MKNFIKTGFLSKFIKKIRSVFLIKKKKKKKNIEMPKDNYPLW
jgi:hypothetical protein